MAEPGADPDAVLRDQFGTSTEDLAGQAERMILALYDPGAGVPLTVVSACGTGGHCWGMSLFRTKSIEQSIADTDDPDHKLRKRPRRHSTSSSSASASSSAPASSS